MREADRKEFARILIGLAAIKPGKGLTPEGLELFFNALADWSIEEFKAAATHLAKTSEFMPNPYHFEELRRAARPTAAECWAEAVEHASSSAYRAGGMGHPVIDKCVRALGGYVAIAMCAEDKLHYLERRFCEHFEALQDSVEVRLALPDLSADEPLVTGPRPIAGLLSKFDA